MNKGVQKIRKTARGHRSSEGGQSLLEVALLTPILLLVAVGLIEIGRYAYEAIRVANAARAGVSYGVQDHFTAGDLPGITNAACNDFAGSNSCSLTVTKTYLCQCDNAGTVGSAIDCTTGTCTVPQREIVSLQVTASGSFSSLFTYPGLPSSLAVTRTATMRIWK